MVVVVIMMVMVALVRIGSIGIESLEVLREHVVQYAQLLALGEDRQFPLGFYVGDVRESWKHASDVMKEALEEDHSQIFDVNGGGRCDPAVG